jgi:hypothetical protein
MTAMKSEKGLRCMALHRQRRTGLCTWLGWASFPPVPPGASPGFFPVDRGATREALGSSRRNAKHTPNNKNKTKNDEQIRDHCLFLAAAWRRTLGQCPRSRASSSQKQWPFGHVVGGGRHEGTSAKRDGGAFLRLEERAECADGRREAERGGPSHEWAAGQDKPFQ